MSSKVEDFVNLTLSENGSWASPGWVKVPVIHIATIASYDTFSLVRLPTHVGVWRSTLAKSLLALYLLIELLL